MSGTSPVDARDSAALERLLAQVAAAPYAHDFYHLVRRIEGLTPQAPRFGRAARPSQEPIRLGQDAELDFAPAAISSLDLAAPPVPRLGVRFFGLFGPQGALPLHLTEHARERLRHHADPTFARFADVFHHRMLSLFYRAWAQAQPTVQHDRPDDDQFAKWLGALFGVAPREFRGRGSVGDAAQRYQAGLLSRGVKNAESLVLVLRLYFGVPVRVQSFVGHWLAMRPQDRTRLGAGPLAASGARLGASATLGSKVWDRQSRFRLHLGPLTLAEYESFLPGSPALRELRDWVRLSVGLARAWDVRLSLNAAEVPAARLGAAAGRPARLGLTSWLGGARRRGEAAPPAAREDLLLNPSRDPSSSKEARHV